MGFGNSASKNLKNNIRLALVLSLGGPSMSLRRQEFSRKIR
jgi:hypothetical protein